MAIESHRCNAPDCKGFVLFDNADFDFKNIDVDEEYGCYAFSNPSCSECGKDYLVVPHYIVIDVKDKAAGDFEEIESACITEYEKRDKELEYEAETDPTLRIMNFLIQRGYTYSVSDIIAEYSAFQEKSFYISHSMKDCFDNLKNEIKQLYAQV